MKFGDHDIPVPLCLAPMEDVSDPPFRRLCREMGADVVYTEFAHCEAVVREIPSQCRKLLVSDDERPVGIQLYGSTEEVMAAAAARAEAEGPDFIDVNCGCWVKKIAVRGDGAGLLRDLPKMGRVIESVMRGTRLPVTVKTRLGWDHDSIVILEVARMLEDLGVKALTVHCRTRCQGYTGRADWSWIARIREVSAIPLIANGDITTPGDLQACLDLGADGVMIGRGAIHRPWVFRHLRHWLETGEELPEPPLRERVALTARHLVEHVAYHGAPRGVFSFRKHYAGYLKGAPHIAQLRRELVQLTEVGEILARLDAYAAELPEDGE